MTIASRRIRKPFNGWSAATAGADVRMTTKTDCRMNRTNSSTAMQGEPTTQAAQQPGDEEDDRDQRQRIADVAMGCERSRAAEDPEARQEHLRDEAGDEQPGHEEVKGARDRTHDSLQTRRCETAKITPDRITSRWPPDAPSNGSRMGPNGQAIENDARVRRSDHRTGRWHPRARLTGLAPTARTTSDTDGAM